jgi:4-hydroxyphenylacetate decarboxylase small subunit
MKHLDCKNYINLDCEKGLCALDKAMVPIDGAGSDACPRFVPAEKCGLCKNFSAPDKHGIGTCSGMPKKAWAYASMSACTCSSYKA